MWGLLNQSSSSIFSVSITAITKHSFHLQLLTDTQICCNSQSILIWQEHALSRTEDKGIRDSLCVCLCLCVCMLIIVLVSVTWGIVNRDVLYDCGRDRRGLLFALIATLAERLSKHFHDLHVHADSRAGNHSESLSLDDPLYTQTHIHLIHSARALLQSSTSFLCFLQGY